MPGKAITFPVQDGNGAREAMLAIAESLGLDDSLADRLLLELWDRGFKVAPLEPEDG